MNIKRRSVASWVNQELAARGYGEEVLSSLSFFCEISKRYEKEKLKFIKTTGVDNPLREACCNSMAVIRSEYMRQIMDIIADKLIGSCDNATPNRQYRFPNDELFFWCNTFDNETGGRLSGRDYNGFALYFNDALSKEKCEEIYRRVMDALAEFRDDESLLIAVQTEIKLNQEKILHDAQVIAPALIGKRVKYQITNELFNIALAPTDGRVVERNGIYYFMKKHAKNKGIRLNEKDILRIFWGLEEGNRQTGEGGQAHERKSAKTGGGISGEV